MIAGMSVAVPVGLFGFEIRMARVAGVIESSNCVERERECSGNVVDLFDVRARDFRVEPVHRVGGTQDDDFVVVIDISVDQDLNGFVGAVGEEQFVWGDLEERGQRWLYARVFGIDAQLLFAELALQKVDHARGTADGVLVEVEAQFARAAAARAASRAPC